ncbi:MAG TPA: DUF2252 domain-containing protein [Thermoplasmata archaeon]|nr:DUF2252 domain-containing protein [Thermoplasmata archaeon]
MAISSSASFVRGRVRSRGQRYAAGKALRRRVPRSSHAEWRAPADRPDPVGLLEASNRNRVPKLVPIRLGRMAASPFGFLRGSAGLMARDLAGTPSTGIRVQLCGDGHVANFGIFATPERDRVFDLNDFDETNPGPWEWDVKRLATSLVLAARQARLPGAVARRSARVAARAYRENLLALASRPYQEIWYSHIDSSHIPEPVNRPGRKEIGKALRKARRRTGLYAFPRLAEKVRGRYRMRDEPPLIEHYEQASAVVESHRFFEQYRASLPPERRMLLDRYRLEDVARKVVGVGSVGTACSILLLLADGDPGDPLFLQLKQANASVLEPFSGPSRYPNHAERVVVGQRLIQEASDVFLGWGTLAGKDYYVRQLRDMKVSLDSSQLGARAFLGHAELCGAAMARAHARTGDPAMLAGYLGEKPGMDWAIGEFAVTYAEQVRQDHRAMLQAIRSGRLPSPRMA